MSKTDTQKKKPSLEFSSVSVVLPSYNESENINHAIQRVDHAVGKSLLEIIIVDDDSPDETWRIVNEFNHPKVRLIRRLHERGLASALAKGVEEARGRIVVWMDCDLGIPPEEIPKLIAKLDKYDLAVGSRFVGKGRDLRKLWITLNSRLINYFAQALLGAEVKDYTSGFIAVRRTVFEKVKINPEGFGEYFIEFVHDCRRNKYRICEVGYIYGDRAGGVSKSTDNFLVFLKLGVGYIKKIIKLGFSKN
ncbi:MAG: glycosyltransferase [Candidatus Aminicenantes bacterium]|nr:glycosyltransferase [Candidatus Aminicenantes bacterium]